MTATPARRVRTLIELPSSTRAGELIEIRATIGHPMETGYRRDASGELMPRNIIRMFQCELAGRRIFTAELFPAISANPMIAFRHRVQTGGELLFRWTGDKAFEHVERRLLNLR